MLLNWENIPLPGKLHVDLRPAPRAGQATSAASARRGEDVADGTRDTPTCSTKSNFMDTFSSLAGHRVRELASSLGFASGDERLLRRGPGAGAPAITYSPSMAAVYL